MTDIIKYYNDVNEEDNDDYFYYYFTHLNVYIYCMVISSEYRVTPSVIRSPALSTVLLQYACVVCFLEPPVAPVSSLVFTSLFQVRQTYDQDWLTLIGIEMKEEMAHSLNPS